MKVTVLSITDNGAVCALDTGIKGLVKPESMIGKKQKGLYYVPSLTYVMFIIPHSNNLVGHIYF